MNPYQPPPSDPPKCKKKNKQKVEVDLKDFMIIFFVVLIGTPLLYGTVLELVEKFLR